MDLDKLRIKQAIFELDRKKINKEYLDAEKIRQNFISKFTINKIGNMTIDEFVVGKRSKESFCYLLEKKLRVLGNIHGSTSIKFGIYYCKDDKKYKYVKRFGDDYLMAFNKIRQSIESLIIAGDSRDLKTITSNNLSNMFKGKILATYFPDKYSSIFSDEHLDYFLDQLGINYNEKDDEILKRECLLEYKNNDVVMIKWRNYDFSKFLYSQIGRPPKLSKNTPEELKYYSLINLPKINDVKYEFIELQLSEIAKSDPKKLSDKKLFKKIDFDRENKINRKIGEHGESIVLRAEREYMSRIGLDKLVSKISQKSKESDSFGYDILSFDEEGNEKYIEVKSTRRKSTSHNAHFTISSNEYRHAVEMSNYYIYIVFEVDTVNPKIFKLHKPFNREGVIKVEPRSYKVSINIFDKYE